MKIIIGSVSVAGPAVVSSNKVPSVVNMPGGKSKLPVVSSGSFTSSVVISGRFGASVVNMAK